jgi:hypothetical protein
MAIALVTSGYASDNQINQDETHTVAIDSTGANFLVATLHKYRAISGAETWDYTNIAPAWNGTAMTLGISKSYPTTNRLRVIEVWYISSPATGSYNLTYTHTPANWIEIGMLGAALSGVNTSDPIGMTYSAQGDSTNAKSSLTTETANSWIAGGIVAGDGETVPILTEANLTEYYYNRNATAYRRAFAAGLKTCTTATTYTNVGWDMDTAERYASAYVEIQESVAATHAGSKLRRTRLASKIAGALT